MEEILLRQMIAEQWDMYHMVDRKRKLDLLRHRFSMCIVNADDIYEYLHIYLDARTELEYSVNKAAAVGDDHRIKGFVRFLFALGEGETKLFIWFTSDGKNEWVLSRDKAVLYVYIPEFKEGFFIRYTDFRDECFAAYEKYYGWGFSYHIQKIEVPATDYDFLQTLDVQDEFELVRFLEDGQSFETTDVERLLQYINECRSAEVVSNDPGHFRIRQFHSLYEAIKYYLSNQERMGRAKKLCQTTGIDFSWLKDNWEECGFRYNPYLDPDDWCYAVYRRYGDLPDGRHFGVCIFPKSGAWPEESAMIIVSKTGEMQVSSIVDGRWDVGRKNRWPLAAVAAPSGKSIVWLKDGEIWVWRESKREKRFSHDGGKRLTNRIDGISVYDALMRDDGILVLFQEGKVYAYLCDEDIVLVRHEDCWVPANMLESPVRNAEFPELSRMDYWPDSFSIMIRRENDEYDYYSCGVRRVCFEPGLEVIKPGILADNPDIESVTIPASIKEVGTWAFGCCTNLKNLVIEGDLTRVANWAQDAFEGCFCEDKYLRLRNADS